MPDPVVDPMLDNITLSSELPTIVDDIREAAYETSVKTGVFQNIVPEFGRGKKGNSVSVPTWDSTSLTAAVALEGELIPEPSKYVNDVESISAIESVANTFITYNDIEDATDDVKRRHSDAIGLALAYKTEAQGHAAAQLFTASKAFETELSLIDLVTMRTTLEAQRATASGNWKCVTNAALYHGILKSMIDNSGYGVRGAAGDEFMKKYSVGTVLGNIDLMQSDVVADFTAETLEGAFFKPDALGMLVRRDFQFETDHSPQRRGWELIATQRKGFGIINDKLGLKFSALNPLYVAPEEPVTPPEEPVTPPDPENP